MDSAKAVTQRAEWGVSKEVWKEPLQCHNNHSDQIWCSGQHTIIDRNKGAKKYKYFSNTFRNTLDLFHWNLFLLLP